MATVTVWAEWPRRIDQEDSNRSCSECSGHHGSETPWLDLIQGNPGTDAIT